MPTGATTGSLEADDARSALLARIVALTRVAERGIAARDVAALLGGRTLVVFVRDEAVGLLLPAPGFPQTLPDARSWRAFVAECVRAGEARTAALVPPDGGPPLPAFGVAWDEEAAAVVLGTDEPCDRAAGLRELLPLLAATFLGERAAEHAATQARAARQAAAHAEALAAALDRTRADLQRAFVAAERARSELETANTLLQDQALELESQADELEAQAEELRRANRAKSDFMATMSHELRTPLNAISGHTQLIALGIHGPVTDAQREALLRIDRSQRHLLGIINDILNLARIEAGRVDYHLAAVPLGEMMEDLRAMIEPQLQAKGLTYEVRVGADTVRADREKLQQVLLNLLSNAAKFTDRGGRVTVEAGRSDAAPDVVLMHVTDTGIGIAPDKLERVFEPFVQVDSSHSRLGQGTGLGLAISRDLARGMGGDLHVRSVLGQGSTFTLSLPEALRE